VDPPFTAANPTLRFSNNFRSTPIMVGGLLYVSNGLGFAEAIDTREAQAALEGVFGPERRIGQLILLRLGFLQANDVGLLFPQPGEEILVGRGADAVGVETDDAHRGLGAEG